MKTNLSQVMGFLLLGLGAVSIDAATTAATTPTPPPIVQATALLHGGAMQASGRCNVFNAGKTGFVVAEVHAEDGQGNVLVSTDAKKCTNKTLAALRACTVTFKTSTVNDSAVCLAKINPPKRPAATTTTTTTAPAAPPAPPAPVLSMELLDNAGAVLVYTNGVIAPPPPPPAPAAQGATNQGGSLPPPPPQP